MTTTLEHLAFRIAKLNVRLEKAAGKARIPGDGDSCCVNFCLVPDAITR